MTNIVETLQAVENLLADPAHWTQGDFARNAKGFGVMEDDSDAVCWCLIGATNKVAGIGLGVLPVRDALRQFLPPGYGLAEYNDTHTHAEVLALIRAAKAAVATGETQAS